MNPKYQQQQWYPVHCAKVVTHNIIAIFNYINSWPASSQKNQHCADHLSLTLILYILFIFFYLTVNDFKQTLEFIRRHRQIFQPTANKYCTYAAS